MTTKRLPAPSSVTRADLDEVASSVLAIAALTAHDFDYDGLEPTVKGQQLSCCLFQDLLNAAEVHGFCGGAELRHLLNGAELRTGRFAELCLGDVRAIPPAALLEALAKSDHELTGGLH